jgi:hypothetical protein
MASDDDSSSESLIASPCYYINEKGVIVSDFTVDIPKSYLNVLGNPKLLLESLYPQLRNIPSSVERRKRLPLRYNSISVVPTQQVGNLLRKGSIVKLHGSQKGISILPAEPFPSIYDKIFKNSKFSSSYNGLKNREAESDRLKIMNRERRKGYITQTKPIQEAKERHRIIRLNSKLNHYFTSYTQRPESHSVEPQEIEEENFTGRFNIQPPSLDNLRRYLASIKFRRKNNAPNSVQVTKCLYKPRSSSLKSEIFLKRSIASSPPMGRVRRGNT